MLESLPTIRKTDPAVLYPQASAEALDMMVRCLQFDPAKRLTAQQALTHPYVAKFHDPANEPSLDRPIMIPIDDNTKFTVKDYREKLYSEVVRKRSQGARRRRRGSSGGTRSGEGGSSASHGGGGGGGAPRARSSSRTGDARGASSGAAMASTGSVGAGRRAGEPRASDSKTGAVRAHSKGH